MIASLNVSRRFSRWTTVFLVGCIAAMICVPVPGRSQTAADDADKAKQAFDKVHANDEAKQEFDKRRANDKAKHGFYKAFPEAANEALRSPDDKAKHGFYKAFPDAANEALRNGSQGPDDKAKQEFDKIKTEAGQEVHQDQILLQLSTIDEGKITPIKVKAGQEVQQGQVLLQLSAIDEGIGDQAAGAEAAGRNLKVYRLAKREADRLVAFLKTLGHEEIYICAHDREKGTTSINASAKDHQRIMALIQLLAKDQQLPPKELGKDEGKIWPRLGLELEPVDASQVRRIKPTLRGGLKVVAVRPDSPAAEFGVREGDVVIGLGKWETVSLKDFDWVLDHYQSGDGQPIKILTLRNAPEGAASVVEPPAPARTSRSAGGQDSAAVEVVSVVPVEVVPIEVVPVEVVPVSPTTRN